MSNMSYCRFQNTSQDLADCMEYLEVDDLSCEEERARKRLIRLAKQIAADCSDE